MSHDAFDPGFKALTDATRRRLLDLLHDRPATTSALGEHFPALTRFAVMKHLSVLEEAGLVRTEKIGRERWKHLCPGPLRQVQACWLGAYDEERGAGPMTWEIEVSAHRRRVYEALTRDVAAWWEMPEDTRDLVLDATLGGQFKRLGVEGSQDLWAIVTGLHPGRRLELQGRLGMSDAVVGRLEFRLEDEGAGTRVLITAERLPGSERLGPRLAAYLG